MPEIHETKPDAWKGHALGGPDAKWCVKDNMAPGPHDDPQAWFAEHLKADGCPDYVVEFELNWRETVADPTGAVDVDKVARELYDYSEVMDQASKVYDDVTRGRFSKPNTSAVYIISAVDERQAELYADMLCEAIAEEDDEDITRNTVIEIAEGWSDGAWDRYSELRERRAKAAAARADA